MYNKAKKDVYIVGSKGIPANYGGFETFVENLISSETNTNIKYHVSCMSNNRKRIEYKKADCFDVEMPFNNALGRLLHVSKVLSKIENERIQKTNPFIIYILGCRIGPLLFFHKNKLKKMNCSLICNPDGLEWKRDKWNTIEKAIIKFCEFSLVSNSDLVVCDSKTIENYINNKYKNKKTTYIAYGAKKYDEVIDDNLYKAWLEENNISEKGYFLVVGRFVPENNYETIIKEFIRSNTKRDLVIITNIEKNKFYEKLKRSTNFETDKRIKFVGTVYNQELLFLIRKNAKAYIHGHEVGGTNPSLVESLSTTKINMLYDIGFNREVAAESALYWTKDSGSLSNLIKEVELLNQKTENSMFKKSKNIISNNFSWNKICLEYEKVFESFLLNEE